MLVRKTPFTLFESFEVTKQNVVRKRSLRYDLNALADFEQETGMGFAQLMNTRAIFATARALLWAGLKHEDRGLTVEAVGTLLSEYVQRGGTIDEVLQAAFSAATEQGAFGKPEDFPQAVPPAENAPSDPAVES